MWAQRSVLGAVRLHILASPMVSHRQSDIYPESYYVPMVLESFQLWEEAQFEAIKSLLNPHISFWVQPTTRGFNLLLLAVSLTQSMHNT